MADPVAGSPEAAARFAEDKHRRDNAGKFSSTGGGPGASPIAPAVRQGHVVYSGGQRLRAVGRTNDGKVVVMAEDGTLMSATAKALTSEPPAAVTHPQIPDDPAEIPDFYVGDQLPNVIEALKAERVPVWSDAYGHTSFLWNKRQMNLRGIGA